MINPEKLTVKSSEALNEALAYARRLGNPLVYDLHLLHALITQDEGIVAPILQKLGVNVAGLRQGVEREIERYPKQSGAQPSLSRELNHVIDRAEEEARSLGDEFISTEHLLLGLADTKGTESKALLGSVGADRASLLEALKAVRGSHRVTDQSPEEKYRALERFTRRARGSWTPSSAAMKRSAASCRFSRAGPRTTPSSLASPEWERPPSPRGSRSAS
jgi:ATP-dependent Clp protease ATP-binding subunit ClpB